jgi:hypothetical protein
MCEGPLHATGSHIVRTDVPVALLYRDLTGFEQCVLQVQRLLG